MYHSWSARQRFIAGAVDPVVLHPGVRLVGPLDAVRGGATRDDSEGMKKRA